MAKKSTSKARTTTKKTSGKTRNEKDSMGEMTVPADVLYGASTQRAVLNFPISGRPVPFDLIAAYAHLKAACATVNAELGLLDKTRARHIHAACKQIAGGLADHGGWQRHFPADIFQTGSGTTTNMNTNEVIANLVCLAKDAPIGSSKNADYLKKGGVHPNDHVNMGQSSNDTFPTAMHIAAGLTIRDQLLPAVDTMADALADKAKAWDAIVKIGRTHLQDATPIRLGQEFSGYAHQLRQCRTRLERALTTLSELAIGGTAVGTGINTHPQFGKKVAANLTATLGAPPTVHLPTIKFREAKNHFEAQHAKDAFVEASSHLRTLAVAISKIANDIRWLGSGPRCGLGELKLPAVQPGSSIMPGKVNPVICESAIMVACQVIGNDAALTTGALGGVGSVLDLNVAMPMMAANLLDSVHLLANTCTTFTGKLLAELEPDEARCAELIEGSLAMVTSLVPVIGYDTSAAIAYEAYDKGVTVRELLIEKEVLPKKDIDRLLNPKSMTKPTAGK